MTESKKPLVIVLSRNYSTGLSVIRSLGAAGYTVDLVASAHKRGTSKIAANSKYVRKYVEIVSKKVKSGGDDELVDAILEFAKASEDKPVLFPTDDYTAAIMDANRYKLEAYCIMPYIVGNVRSMIESMDKTVQGNLARKAGLKTPLEWIIPLNEEEIPIPENMVYPCFCKPIESITGYKSEMAACQDEAELLSHLKKLRKRHAERSVLVQEFLHIDNEIDINGVCLDQEIILPAIIKKTNVGQHEKGVTLSGKLYPPEELGDIREKVIEMLKSFHYMGMFDMELNIVGDEIYFNEVNFRSGGPNFSYFMSGINLPALYVKEALGNRHTPEEERVKEFGKSFVYEKVAWHDYIYGYMTKSEFEQCLQSADFTLLCTDDDPVPGDLFTASIKAEHKLAKKKRRKEKIKKQKRKLRRRIRTAKEVAKGYPQYRLKNKRDASAEMPRIMVIGRNYRANLALARSFGKAGYEVEVIRVYSKKIKSRGKRLINPEVHSKYVKAYYTCIAKRRKRIIKKLKSVADSERPMLLITTDKKTQFEVNRKIEQLLPYYIIPNNSMDYSEYKDYSYKYVQKKLAVEAGIPVNPFFTFTVNDDGYSIPDEIVYPCRVKIVRHGKILGKKTVICSDESELKEYISVLPAHETTELFVEQVPEIRKRYKMVGVSTNDATNGMVLMTKEYPQEDALTENSELSRNTLTRIVTPYENSEFTDKLIDFVRSFDIEGMYSLNFSENADGELIFDKIYFGYSTLGKVFDAYGTNLPAMFADYILKNEPLGEITGIETASIKTINEKVLFKEYYKERISMDDISSHMSKADVHYIMDEEDIKPYKHFRKLYRLISISRSARIRFRRKKRAIKESVLRYPQYKSKNKRNANADLPRILVTGYNYRANLSVAKLLGKAGYQVEVLRAYKRRPKSKIERWLNPEAYSKYVKAYYNCVAKRDRKLADKLISIADSNNKMLLIPTDKRTLLMIDRELEKLNDYYLIPNSENIPGELRELSYTVNQRTMAAEAGIPVNKFCIMETENREFEIPKGISYPCAVRIMKGDGLSGKPEVCENETELRVHIERLSYEQDVTLFIEDSETIAKKYNLLGVSTKDSINGLTLMVSQYENMDDDSDDNDGEDGDSEKALINIVYPYENNEFTEKLIEFAKSFEFDGMYSMTFFETADGRLIFDHMSFGYNPLGNVFYSYGVNFPEMFADYMLKHKALDEYCGLGSKEIKTVNERNLLNAFAKGRISMQEVTSHMLEADVHLIMDKEDMQPYRHFKKFYTLFTIRSMIKNRKHPVLWIKNRIKGLPQAYGKNARDNSTPRVLVTGRNYCSNLCMARSLGLAGYDVEILKIFQKKPKKNAVLKTVRPDAYSKYVKAYHECVSDRIERNIVNKLISIANPEKKMLLIPADDLLANIADENLNELKQYYLLPNVDNREGEITRLMNKGVQKRMAKEAGLPVINSCIIRTENGYFTIPESVKYPCFIKPNVSKNSSKSRMRKCDSEQELYETLVEFSKKKDIEMIVEDFVDIAKEYSILGVSTRDGANGPGFFVAEEGGQKEHRGVALLGRVLPCSMQQELIDNLVKFVGSLKFDGLYDIDLIETTSGEMLFVEINMRFGASGYAFTECGVNLPGMFADYMFKGVPIDQNAKVKVVDKLFTSEKILIDEYAQGRIDKSKFDGHMNDADIHFIYNKDDMAPYEHFKKIFKAVEDIRTEKGF